MVDNSFSSSSSSTSDNSKHNQDENDNTEIFQVIDESGEGFGFDLTPETLFRPLMIGTVSLFGLGMLGGVPIGIAMGRSSEEGSGKKLGSKAMSGAGKTTTIRPSLDGLKFAATTFGLGTLLCASFGVVGCYAIKTYYKVDSFEQFGQAMRQAVPQRRLQMESNLSPMLQSVRQNAGDGLPPFAQRMRERFELSRFGRWIKNQVDQSVNIVDDDEQVKAIEQSKVQERSSSSTRDSVKR